MDDTLTANGIRSHAIALAVIVFILMSLGIILFVILYQRRVINHQIQMKEFNRQKQLELMQAAIRGEEEERMRIATELHDDVGATLSSVRLFLHQAVRDPGDKALTAQTKQLLDESIQKVRDLSHQLQPGTLQYLGLIKALQSLAEIITRSGAIRMQVVLGGGDWPDPGPQTALSIYRIIQEMVNNIVKHADATVIRLMLQNQEGRYCLSVTHDGNGLTEAEYQEQLYKKGAIGLKNIENRLKSCNLSLVFPEPSGDIYAMMICLPLQSG